MQKIPTYQKSMLPTVIALQKLGGKATVNQIDLTVMALLNLSQKDENINKYHRALQFARTYLKKFGIISNEIRGTWILDDKYINMETEKINEIINRSYKEYYAR